MSDPNDGGLGPVDVVGGSTGSTAPPPAPVMQRPRAHASPPPAPLAWAVMGIFGIGGLSALVAAMGGILDMGTGALDGGASDIVVVLVGGLLMLGGLGQVFGVLLGLVLLAIWTGMAVSAYTNATDDSVGHKPVFAGLSYFICFVNFFVPHQVMTRLWERTTEYDVENPMAATPAWVKLWWPMWLVANFLGRAATSVSETDIGVLDVLSSATFALTAAMTVFLIKSLQARLEAVAEAS